MYILIESNTLKRVGKSYNTLEEAHIDRIYFQSDYVNLLTIFQFVK